MLCSDANGFGVDVHVLDRLVRRARRRGVDRWTDGSKTGRSARAPGTSDRLVVMHALDSREASRGSTRRGGTRIGIRRRLKRSR